MLNWVLIIIFTLCSTITSYGFGWGDVGECFTDPCNCGHDKRFETWGGDRVDKGNEDYNCPPYDKTSGRTSCLKQFSWIKAGTQFYHEVCAEETPSSDYSTPKIRIRSQACNNLACWTVRKDLDWEGQCIVLGGPYGVPMKRVCARIAVKRFKTNPDNGLRELVSVDQGYNEYNHKHLDHEGYTVDDDPVYDFEGNLYTDLNPPKLCAYSDPSILSLNGLDVLDINPNRQSMHQTAETHPIIEAIIALVDLATTLATSFYDLLAKLWGFLGSSVGIDLESNIMASMYTFISDVIEFLGESVVVPALEFIGQMNRIVDTDPITYGCVNIPIGPMPPPFPDSLRATSSMPTTQYVCPINQADNQDPVLPVKSIINNKCVFSERKNNYINNVIRVGFDDFVPLCSGDENPMETDKCVRIENFSSFSTPKAMHAVTGLRDIIKKCEDAAAGDPCVRTKIEHSCSVSEYGCQDGFRVSYSIKIGERAVPMNYFIHDIEPCSQGGSPCLIVWGINTGEFYDVALKFPEIETEYSALDLVETFSLKNKNNNNLSFTAKIVRSTPSEADEESLLEADGQICVSRNNKILGCENRPLPFAQLCDVEGEEGTLYDQLCYSVPEDKIIKYKNIPTSNTHVYECGYNGINCSPQSSYFRPKLILSTKIDGFYSSSVIEPLNIYSGENNSSYDMNHLGSDFSSFVTDNNFRTRPFEGEDAPAPNYLFGKYLDDVRPYDASSQTENPNSVYLSDLEYIEGAYAAGGKLACLSQAGLKQCPEDSSMCVLTKLLETSDVSCAEFSRKREEYGDLKPCDSSYTECSKVHNFSNSNIEIRTCEQGYCYKSPNGKYLCVTSFDAANRQDPAGPVETLNDSQYYDINAAGARDYNKDLYTLRSKTPKERNLCVEVPQPTCASIEGYPTSDASANWPEATVGEKVAGTCPNNLAPIGDLNRYCLANKNTQSVSFGPIPSGAGCSSNQCQPGRYPYDASSVLFEYYLVGNKNEPPKAINDGEEGYAWIVFKALGTDYILSEITFRCNATTNGQTSTITNVTGPSFYKSDISFRSDNFWLTDLEQQLTSPPYAQ